MSVRHRISVSFRPGVLVGLLAAPIPPRITVACLAIIVLTVVLYWSMIMACNLQERRRRQNR